MSKTNFDDIELAGRGIEAGEISSEAATVGQVLMADGVGGVAWGPAARLRVRVAAAISEEGLESFAYRYRTGSTVAGALSITQQSTGLYILVSDSEDLAALFMDAYSTSWPAEAAMIDGFNNGVLGANVYVEGGTLYVKITSSATNGAIDWNGAFELDLVA